MTSGILINQHAGVLTRFRILPFQVRTYFIVICDSVHDFSFFPGVRRDGGLAWRHSLVLFLAYCNADDEIRRQPRGTLKDSLQPLLLCH